MSPAWFTTGQLAAPPGGNPAAKPSLFASDRRKRKGNATGETDIEVSDCLHEFSVCSVVANRVVCVWLVRQSRNLGLQILRVRSDDADADDRCADCGQVSRARIV
jgi:hypothetical protein